NQLLGGGHDAKALQLILEANGSEQAERVGAEDGVGDRDEPAGSEVAVAVVRIDRLVATGPLGDRVDREVALGEVLLDRAWEWREIDGKGVPPPHEPGAVPL